MTLPAVFTQSSVNFISRARINDLLKAQVISREEIIAYPQPRSARDVNNVRPAIPVKAYLQLNISYECNSYYSQLVFNIIENTHDMLLIGVPGSMKLEFYVNNIMNEAIRRKVIPEWPKPCTRALEFLSLNLL